MASSSTYNASPSGSRTSRRRSNSLSSDSRVHDLEAELASLRQNGGSSLELDALKTQLATAKRELNKAINEKIWVESKAKKEVDAVKDLLENANYELDGMRRDLEDGGSISRKEMEKRQKVWEGERAELSVRIQDLEGLVEDGQTKLSELQSAANEAEHLSEELDQERSKPALISTRADHAEELSRLSEEVRSLQSELVRARAQNPPSSSAPASSSSELTIRRLERNLDKARRDAEALEESLNQAEEENQALRTRIPLPSSPGLKADDGKVVELEIDNERLQGEVSQLQEQVRSLRRDLATLQASLAKAQESEEALERVQGTMVHKEAAWDTERQVSCSCLIKVVN
jgi:DNA repair exonuclease SbcCD ATPase subunit